MYPSTSLFVSVTVYLPGATSSKVSVYLPSSPFVKSFSVSVVCSSLTLPSLSSHLPSAFLTSNVSAPSNSDSVTFRPSTLFVMTSFAVSGPFSS